MESPASFKTLQQLVHEHIGRSAALVHDPVAFTAESERAMARMANRLSSDPALATFTTHFAQALAASLRVIPPGLHSHVIQSVLVQAVMEWEDVNLAFDGQLKTTSTA